MREGKVESMMEEVLQEIEGSVTNYGEKTRGIVVMKG